MSGAPLPTTAVLLNAPELRALAAFHDQFAAAADVCCQFEAALAGEARALELRNLADAIGPKEGEADGVL